jgi:hypothetical protein
MFAHHVKVDKPQQEDKISAQIATQDAQHAQPPMELNSALIVYLNTDF